MHCRQEPLAAQTQRLEASRTGSEQQGKPSQGAALLWGENRRYRGFPKDSERKGPGRGSSSQHRSGGLSGGDPVVKLLLGDSTELGSSSTWGTHALA